MEGVTEVRKRVAPRWVRSRISRRSLGVVAGAGEGEGRGAGEAAEEEGVLVAVAEEDDEDWFGGMLEVFEG